MFERFTNRARQVMVLAQAEARGMGHGFIGTEHLLIGLIAEGEGVGAKALTSFGLTPDAVRAAVVAIAAEEVRSAKDTGKRRRFGDTDTPPFTPRAKKVLELSLREALTLGHNYIGTEHILLGLVREREGVGAKVLAQLGAPLPDVKKRVLDVLSGTAEEVRDLDSMSAAMAAVMTKARQHGVGRPLTTGDMLLALSEIEGSQAEAALLASGLGPAEVAAKLFEIPVETTTDAPPRPQVVEIKLGSVSTVIADPELADAVNAATPAQIEAALRTLKPDAG
jgi:ATP-dependent Clp protease ATP-binding subunit ClpC